MNRSMLLVIGGALVVAIVVAMLVQMGLKKDGSRSASGPEILVAAKTMLTGETLKSEGTRWQRVPEAMVYKGVIKRKGQKDEKNLDVYNKPLRRTIEAGEPITRQTVLVDAGKGSLLSASIAPTMRATAVSVKANTSVAGFVAPGDYVDVIVTYSLSLKGDASKFAASEIQRYASETVLSNVHVLAVDQNDREAGKKAKVGKTVTLELTKEQVQRLAVANKLGTISLALRRIGEKDTVADANTPTTTDVRTSRVIQTIYNMADGYMTNTNTVRVYNGASVENMPVRAAETE